jgi:hypothetical protein
MRPLSIPVIVLLFLVSACGPSKKSIQATPGNSSRQLKKSPAEKLDDQTFKLTSVSDDPSYGYSEKNPIKVGGVNNSEGPLNERRFLNALLGPDNQLIKYRRLGSCCPFDTPNGLMGGGLLDQYEITYEGLEKPIVLYINMYDYDVLLAPKGFTFKK